MPENNDLIENFINQNADKIFETLEKDGHYEVSFNAYSFDAYQREAKETAVYPGQGSFLGVVYCSLKLAGEAGEVAEKIGKVMRDDNSIISDEKRTELIKELGDVLWYLSQLAEEFDTSFGEVAVKNVEKLQSRHERGVIHGSGDNR